MSQMSSEGEESSSALSSRSIGQRNSSDASQSHLPPNATQGFDVEGAPARFVGNSIDQAEPLYRVASDTFVKPFRNAQNRSSTSLGLITFEGNSVEEFIKSLYCEFQDNCDI